MIAFVGTRHCLVRVEITRGHLWQFQKRGSRKIVVDGVEYRWYIRRKNEEQALSLAVQRVDEGPTSILSIEFRRARPDAIEVPALQIGIKPAEVVTYIRAALAAGWQPSHAGAPFIYTPKGN